MRKQILLLLILLLPLVSCNGYTIPEDALYPLKIGVLAVEEGSTVGTLRYIQPGETILTRQSCDYDGETTVNICLSFEIDGGMCTLTAENGDVQICTGAICRSLSRNRSANPALWLSLRSAAWYTISPAPTPPLKVRSPHCKPYPRESMTICSLRRQSPLTENRSPRQS